jgi:hypothetical protein
VTVATPPPEAVDAGAAEVALRTGGGAVAALGTRCGGAGATKTVLHVGQRNCLPAASSAICIASLHEGQ